VNPGPGSEAQRWPELREVLGAALEQPPEERLAFLRAKISDPDLLSEAEHLLGLESRARDIFAVTNWRDRMPTEMAWEEVPTGSIFGAYRVLREIGRGGMGAVYLAERADGTYDQRVAIKLLQQSISSPEMEKRFRSERQILASLNHPGVARLLDGGVTPTGLHYLVLEFVEGEPVDRYCDENHLDLRERLRLFLKIAEAVQASHQKLVLHLDLKPANILVTREGEPRLLDFGIARLLADGDVTQPSQMLMTPRYASPEQVKGGPLGVGSDVFSLSTLLYYLLTGRLPYPMEAASPLEAARMIVEEEPELPSKRADASLAAGLRGDLDTILLTGLRKDVSRRYPTIAALSTDITNYLEARPVLAHKDSFAYRASKFFQRHRLAVVGTAVASVLIVASVAAVAYSAVEARRQRASALASAAVARRETTRAEAAASEAEQQRTSAQRSATLAERERNSAQKSAALALREQATAERERASAERDRASAERRLTDIQDLSRFYVMDLFPSVTDIPGTLAVQKKMTENALKYLQSMSEDRSNDPKFSNDLAAGLYSMAVVQGFPNAPSLGDRAGALKLFNMAIEMQKRHAIEAPNDPNLHARMGLMLAMKSNVENSLGNVPEAIALEEQAWNEVQPVLKGPKTTRWMQIATYCFFHAAYSSLDGQFNMADPADALIWIERAEKLLTDLTDAKPEFKSDPKYITALENTRMAKAWYLHQLRRDAEARALYEEQYRVVESAKDSKSIEIEKHRRDLRAAYADFLIDAGEFDRAAEMASILMPYRESHVQTDDDTWDKIDIASELCRAAIIAFHQGRTEDAMRAMNQSLELGRGLRKTAPNDQVSQAQYVMNLVALAQTPQMPKDRAQQMFEEAITLAGDFSRTHPTVMSAHILEARSHLGLARLAQGEHRTQDQRRESEQARAILEHVAANRPKSPEPRELLVAVQSLRE